MEGGTLLAFAFTARLVGLALKTRAAARRAWDWPFEASLGIALVLHMGLLLFSFVSGMMADMHLVVTDGRVRLHDYFFRQYEVEVVKPKEAPPPEPPPDPEPPPPAPAPAPKALKPVDDDPYKEPAPQPAQATKILAAEAKPDEPVALDGFVSGEGSVVGGQQSGDGKGDKVTMAMHTSLKGVEGGRGVAPAVAPPPPPPSEDRSRPVSLLGGKSWNCPFPPEADADQIDQAVVVVQVTVKPDGSASSANVTSDPGHGFGRAARNCALGKRYQPALDRSGTAIVSSNPVSIRFNR